MKEEKQITFFIDRCLGKKHIAEALRKAGITVEIHDDHFENNAQDVEWLPEVGKKGWVVLTKDAKIGKNNTEQLAVAYAGIKMFALASQNLSGPDMAQIFLATIVKMQEFVRQNPAPFIAKVYRDGRIDMYKDAEKLKEKMLKEDSY
ncbi:hypothetical protein [Gloeothece verrucosa]|uniref:VapC45 PIN like domain-containing protein n=1 Tax=Gloeothece verrucosa (strain PCC 7822) TaxID=497965 RepID=E0UAX9_GLOV7|nr:hypothetical protein [Gloeothece verrucosa]ADN15101.1 conserved hypothetical protein [Gloeothece verrucosa PCC 7822]